MADKTLAFVLSETFSDPFTTRDTVAVETPAVWATSLKVQDMMYSPRGNPSLQPDRVSSSPSLAAVHSETPVS